MSESFGSVFPIVAVVAIIYFAGFDGSFCLSQDLAANGWAAELASFLVCALLVSVGLGLFAIGVDQSLSRIGSLMGGALTKKGSLSLLVVGAFAIGFLITVAEPDLMILAAETGMNEALLIGTVSAGVGLFLVIGTTRIIFQADLRFVFLIVFSLAFCITNLAAPELIPLAFDSGGIATGPVTIPFILAFGSGVAASREGSHSGSDDFGLSAHAMMGPIIAVLVLGLFFSGSHLSYDSSSSPLGFASSSYGSNFSGAAIDVLLGMAPIALLFVLLDLFHFHLPPKELLKIFIGLLNSYIGLVVFLGAVQTGFLPVAQNVGKAFAGGNGLPYMLLIGAFFGCFAVLAEPAVAVLVEQIQSVSEGTIKKGWFLAAMAIGVALAVVLSVIRAYYRFDILWYLVPGYILALLLVFLVPRIYSSIAFDSGTVAAGPMAASFTMPFVLGFAGSLYEAQGLAGSELAVAIYENAFGVVSMVTMMPIIVVQLVGLYAELKRKALYASARRSIMEPDDAQIIHFEEADGL